MKLRRRGSRRNYGWDNMFDSHQRDEKFTFHWDDKENTFTLQLSNIQDPTASGPSAHDYEIMLGIEDINHILEFLSKEPLVKSGRAISEGLIGSTQPLFRLLLSSLISDLEALRRELAMVKSEQLTLNRKVKQLESDVEQLESDKP